MTGDYKYEMQMIAEEAAEEMGLDYWSLTLDQQCDLYSKASREWVERKLGQADLLRKMAKETK